MYKVQFCVNRDIFEEASLPTKEAIRAWVKEIEARHGFRDNIFDSAFHYQNTTVEQWGTGYFWLTVETIVPEE